MSLHLLTAQIAQDFCLLFTLPWDHPFPPGNTIWGQEFGHIRRQLMPAPGSLTCPAWHTSVTGQCGVSHEVNILPILGFWGFLSAQPPFQEKEKNNQKRQIILQSDTKYQEHAGFSPQLWFHFKVLKIKNIILYRHPEKCYWKVLSRLSENTGHHLEHPIGFLTFVFSIGCCWVFGAS